MKRAIALCLAAAALMPAPVSAHHSFAMFDARQTLTVKASVTEFQWANPHCWIELDVSAGQGAHKGFTHIALEANALSYLRAGGWNARTLKPGDQVTVEYHPMRDGTPAGQLLTLRLANGTLLKGQ
ncbi:hypothetical protein H7F51_11550 [Novosphingobium flavum]|uniref:Uncharacterized protein n=1 Tax=Novosphingobium flavum TaxID=1778672 RepID=A0A7X1FSG7_9SPHN|nr:DUF6152 family protein [Novosphingobium flavum]MBC2666153.1 hypothetical protein [Novosphingobium flavum]